MKLNDLKNAVLKAQQDQQLAEGKAIRLRQAAKAAKAKFQQARLHQKRLRKAAKEAKKLALKAEDQACEKGWALEKAQERLAKALKQSKPQNTKPKSKPIVLRPSVPRKPAPVSQPVPAVSAAVAATSAGKTQPSVAQLTH